MESDGVSLWLWDERERRSRLVLLFVRIGAEQQAGGCGRRFQVATGRDGGVVKREEEIWGPRAGRISGVLLPGRRRLWVAPAGAGLWSLVSGVWSLGSVWSGPGGEEDKQAGVCVCLGHKAGAGAGLRRFAKRWWTPGEGELQWKWKRHGVAQSAAWKGREANDYEKPGVGGSDEFLKKTGVPSRALCRRRMWCSQWTGGRMVCDGGPLTVRTMPAPGTLALSEFGLSRGRDKLPNHGAKKPHT